MSESAQPDMEPASFDKVIFMMIDALRSDFVYASNTGFSYTQSLIRPGAAIPLTAWAASPTLTISHIKALTQGTSQSFLDAWLNIANNDDARRLDGEDTWLYRLKTEKHVRKKMVFYGIDVWTVLYPEIWDRYEVTDSFYVPDFTSVDTNATRHVPGELENDDWKSPILHYLGVDNLAHHSGPLGSLMVPKQAEMDDVVRMIYEAIEHKPHLQNTLFVLAGDHGMTDRGNHGGDTPSELASAMIFISPRLQSISKGLESPLEPEENYEYYSIINQIDIVPTLAGLLGFPVPANSVGMFVWELLALFRTDEKRHQLLLENAKQIMSSFKARYKVDGVDAASCGSQCDGCRDEGSEVVCLWEKVGEAEKQWSSSHEDGSEELIQVYPITGFTKTFLFQDPVFLWGLVFKLYSTKRVNPELLSFTPLWLEELVGEVDYQHALRISWAGLTACLVFVLIRFKTSGRVSKGVVMLGFVELANLYLRSLARPQNLILYQIYDLHLRWLLSPTTGLSISEIAVTALLLGQSSFYASGRNDSVASLDLMNGFNGVGESNIVAVFFQTLTSNWLGPIWWSLASLRLLLAWLEAQNVSATSGLQSGKTAAPSRVPPSSGVSLFNGKDDTAAASKRKTTREGENRRPLFEFLGFQTFYMGTSSLAVMLACLWQRNDPALWTVLAPKYVNTALWTVFYHVLMTAVLGTGVWGVVVGYERYLPL
ncbi:hypothetical protein DL765_009140 [Monosporascus sp. GIB2]|nr:hypothetical protein DL765_009140 [Monosporascus sp. GIB2]